MDPWWFLVMNKPQWKSLQQYHTFCVSCSTFTLSLCFVHLVISQNRVDFQAETADKLGQTIFLCKNKWNTETTELAQYVLTKYEKPIPLSPYSMFNLNRSGFLSTIAIVVTYLVVLLQFRSSEIWNAILLFETSSLLITRVRKKGY